MLERGCTVAGGLGLGDPELGAENEIAIGVHLLLGVDDPRARGHQVQLAGTDDLLIAEAVSVHELTRDQPCHRLEPDVGVRTDGEALTVCGERADVVEETPGADRAPGAPGQQASDRDTGELGAPCGDQFGDGPYPVLGVCRLDLHLVVQSAAHRWVTCRRDEPVPYLGLLAPVSTMTPT